MDISQETLADPQYSAAHPPSGSITQIVPYGYDFNAPNVPSPRSTYRYDPENPRPCRKRSHGVSPKTRSRMKAFLAAMKRTFGNINESCEIIGITRRTYERWSDIRRKHIPAYARFQETVDKYRAPLQFVEAAETVVRIRLSAGDLDAAKFTLERLGHTRGWVKNSQSALNGGAAAADLLLTNGQKGMGSTDPLLHTKVSAFIDLIAAQSARKGVNVEDEFEHVVAVYGRHFDHQVIRSARLKLFGGFLPSEQDFIDAEEVVENAEEIEDTQDVQEEIQKDAE